MNYNIPLNYNIPMDPIYKIQLLEQEILKLKNDILVLENKVNRIEDNKKNNNFNTNVSNKEDGLYML